MSIRSTVIADASFCHRTRAGGWAVWININYPDGGHERIKKSGTFHERPRSSEHAEQMACMNGIWLAYQRGARDILVQNDCLGVIQTYGKGSSQKSAKTYAKAAKEHWPNASIRWRHVKGHNLHKVNDARTFVNEWCDTEAKKHMRKQRGSARV